jgi:hypothetical protein
MLLSLLTCLGEIYCSSISLFRGDMLLSLLAYYWIFYWLDLLGLCALWIGEDMPPDWFALWV